MRPCIVLGLLVAVVASVWLYNTRHHRAWLRMKAAMIARGEPMSYEELIPPKIPDSENFAAQPLFDELIKAEGDGSQARLSESKLHYVRKESLSDDDPYPIFRGDWQQGWPHDLSVLAYIYRRYPEVYSLDSLPLAHLTDEEIVLQALSIHRPTLSEVESYLGRPSARYHQTDELKPGARWMLLLALRSLSHLQLLQAQAHLNLGESEEAVERLQKAFQLTETLANEPTSASQLGRQTLWGNLLTVVWEGWCRSRWNLQQLETLDRALAKVDFIHGWKLGTRHDRLLALDEDLTAVLKERNLTSWGKFKPVQLQLVKLIPSGLWDLNRIHYCQDLDQYLQEVYQEEKHIFDFSKFRFPHYSPGVLFENPPNRILSTFYLWEQEFATRRTAMAQTSLALARAALHCAMFRERTGHWPLNLESIHSGHEKSLGMDPFSGQWLRYVPPAKDDPTGIPVLYSVSFNGVDDGGVAVLDRGLSEGHHLVIRDLGDLVWTAKLRYLWVGSSREVMPTDQPVEVFTPFETRAP